MSSTAEKYPGVFRRSQRRRHMLHAAELLEREAKWLSRCHTYNQQWQDASARVEHDDLIDTADALRGYANG